MKKVFTLTGCIFILLCSLRGQSITQRLEKSFIKFEYDEQLNHAISSLYIVDASTGQVVFDRNSQIGLAPASTQKIITAATAFELLGQEFRYKTKLEYIGKLVDGKLNGNIIISGSSDPSFGSWRWNETNEETVMEKFVNALKSAGIKKIDGSILVADENWSTQQTPDGWIEQDKGNYYGAGSVSLNWRENQFDVFLKSGAKIGDPVLITGYKPQLYLSSYTSEVKSAEKGTGDNAYIYQHPNIIRGTIPVNENNFEISGSMINPPGEFIIKFSNALLKNGIEIKKEKNKYGKTASGTRELIYTYSSPTLDTLIYWFLKKSINLYGESLLKTFAFVKKKIGSTEEGIEIVKDFWKQNGVDENELNLSDGSGLSPQNRVTTHAQVQVLMFAKARVWFPSFINALPEFNGMKMKSGTIRDVKGYCGYHKSKDGREYIFSFLVNNYNGKSSTLISKMYKVLDELK